MLKVFLLSARVTTLRSVSRIEGELVAPVTRAAQVLSRDAHSDRAARQRGLGGKERRARIAPPLQRTARGSTSRAHGAASTRPRRANALHVAAKRGHLDIVALVKRDNASRTLLSKAVLPKSSASSSGRIHRRHSTRCTRKRRLRPPSNQPRTALAPTSTI